MTEPTPGRDATAVEAARRAIDAVWRIESARVIAGLSRYVGDAAAHQIGNAVRDLMSWGRDAAERLSKDLAEYLQYESRDLPPRHEVQDFLNNVDKLRDDAERLAARLQRAASRVKQA